MGSLPGSSVHGIFQAGILVWVVISFSRGSSWPRARTWVSCIIGGFFTVWATRGALFEVYPPAKHRPFLYLWNWKPQERVNTWWLPWHAWYLVDHDVSEGCASYHGTLYFQSQPESLPPQMLAHKGNLLHSISAEKNGLRSFAFVANLMLSQLFWVWSLHLTSLVWSDCFSLRNLTSSYFIMFGLPWVKDYSQPWESQPQSLAYQLKLSSGMPTLSVLGVGTDNTDQETRVVILVRILSFSSWKKPNSNQSRHIRQHSGISNWK